MSGFGIVLGILQSDIFSIPPPRLAPTAPSPVVASLVWGIGVRLAKDTEIGSIPLMWTEAHRMRELCFLGWERSGGIFVVFLNVLNK